MASACVNNIGMASENFLDCSPAVFPSFGWLSPRISFDREESNASKLVGGQSKSAEVLSGGGALDRSDPDLEASPGDFEFRLDDPVRMLPADELFFDGKLVPLHLTSRKPPTVRELQSAVGSLPEIGNSRQRADVSVMDPYLFSPKAPRCSSRWKELLGLKKLYLNANSKNENHHSTASSSFGNNTKPLKNLLHRSSKSLASSDASLSLPLLQELDCDSISVSSSRVSLSSSSSGHEHEDLPRLSHDSDKPSSNQNFKSVNKSRHLNPNGRNAPRMRMVRPRAAPAEPTPRPTADHPMRTSRVGRSPMRRCPAESSGVESRGVSVDSPRMNASGKVVFQSLERSSSSPSTFNGGPRFKHRGMERSYSANVRVTPVLNVPVCSLRGSSKSVSVFGLGQLFTSLQKKEANGNGGNVKAQHSRNRIDRTNS